MRATIGAVAGLLATAGVAYLVLVAPFRTRRGFAKLLGEVERDPGARIRYYRRTLGRGAISAAVALAIGGLAAGAGFDIGLGPARNPSLARMYAVELAVLLPATAVLFRAVPRLYQRIAARSLGRAVALLPVTRAERAWFAAVAVSAGLWEEVVFRGFLMGSLRWLLPHPADPVLVIGSALVFGWAHLYQGPRGVVLTGLAGLLLGALALWSGGLVVPMVVHALIDLRFTLTPPAAAPTTPPEPTATGAPA